MRTPLVLLLVAASAAAGCLGEPAFEPEAYRISGAFTEEATQEDFEALRAQVAQHGADLQLLESFPVQYQVTGFPQESCNDIRALLDAKDYVATVGPCEPFDASSASDEPVASGPP